MLMSQNCHCVECPNREFFLVFSRIWTEYRDLPGKSPYSVRLWENMDLKKLLIWTRFTKCVC